MKGRLELVESGDGHQLVCWFCTRYNLTYLYQVQSHILVPGTNHRKCTRYKKLSQAPINRTESILPINPAVHLAPCSLYGNRDGLHQVFNNLLQNMTDYDIGKKISIKGFVEDHKYIVQFSHQGKEIAEDEKDLIFERFYRVDSSRSFVTGGAGLGLAITKEIVQAHSCTLTLDTNGHHHTFEVRLPINHYDTEENQDESTMV
jgi:signal transduction histidine kinase